MYKNFKNLIATNLKKSLWINFAVFFYLTIVLVNFFHNNYDPYKKINYGKESINVEVFTKSDNYNRSLKVDISNQLSDEKTYGVMLDRSCKITGDMHDRHKVRWVKNIFLKKIFAYSESLNQIAPYYVNIFLHSLILFFTFFLINSTFNYSKNYNYLFLAYITFIFQQNLSEYSYSIFEMFFLSLALYSSKNKNIFIFFLACALATLNRESGFIILTSWFIFNKDIKKILIITFSTTILFLILNFDLINCLFNPKFFIPFVNQEGQANLLEVGSRNLFSNSKLLFVNFFMPFGLVFYFLFYSTKINKALILISLLYLLAFIFASVAHHISVRMLLLPIIFTAIHFYSKNKLRI